MRDRATEPRAVQNEEAATPQTVLKNEEEVLSKGSVPEEQLQQIMAKAQQLVRLAKQTAEFRFAAENLEFYLQGKKNGKRTKTMPSQAFIGEKFLFDWLRAKVLPEFANGAQKRIKSGELKFGGTVAMTWRDSVVAPEGSSLWFALGGFTVVSDVVVSAREIPEDPSSALVLFDRWELHIEDEYNWDPQKSTFIQLVGDIPDEDMRKLEDAGLAASYDVRATVDALPLLGKVEVAVPR